MSKDPVVIADMTQARWVEQEYARLGRGALRSYL